MVKTIFGTPVQRIERGKPALIRLDDGRYMQTSIVCYVVEHPNGEIEMATQNSRYRIIQPKD